MANYFQLLLDDNSLLSQQPSCLEIIGLTQVFAVMLIEVLLHSGPDAALVEPNPIKPY